MNGKIRNILLGIFSFIGIAITSALAISQIPLSITILPSPSILSIQYLANNNLTVTIYYSSNITNTQLQGYNYLYIFSGNGQLLYEKFSPVTLYFNQYGNGELNYTINGAYLYDELLLYPYAPLTINDTLCALYNSEEICTTSIQQIPLTNVQQSTIFEFVNPQNQIYTQKYLETYGLTLNLFASLGTAQENISQSELTITVENSNGKILYTYSENVNLNEGINEFSIYIPGYVFENQYGEINVYATLSGVYTNSQVLNAQTNYTFYIETEQTPIEILSVSPNFNLLENLQQEAYSISALLYNQLSENVNAELIVYMYDQYGNLVYQNSVSEVINPYQQALLSLPLNLYLLQPGVYNINIEILEELEGQNQYEVIYNRTYKVTLDQLQIYPINVISVLQTEYNILPNSYATFILTIQNVEPYQVSVQPYLMSQQLNIFQELSTITLQPNQVEQIPLTIYIPSNLTAGYYPITLDFYYNGAFEQYTFNIYVNGTKPEIIYYPIIASIISPSRLIAGENNTVTLLLESNTTSLYNISVTLSSNNAEIYPNQIYTLIGGTSYTEQYNINIYPLSSGETNIYVDVYNALNGQLLYNTTVTLYSESSGITSQSQYIIYALIAIIIILLIGSIIYDLTERKGKKRKKEEEPEE